MRHARAGPRPWRRPGPPRAPRTPAPSPGAAGRVSPPSRAQLWLPAIDVHGAGGGVLAPEIARLEAHVIEPVRHFLPERVRVGEDMEAVHPGDRSRLAAAIAGQARVGGRVPFARPHAIARLEERRRAGVRS